ncbi:pilus assembly protein [Parasphingorhabdus halotolerans]|uniref:Putative Flp pilus-assembly TadG-like N-terminal domain-containing protein n=1 Tax=Parasphingorhabdus halotolerans TaxID=2725558 RepID=A0A6H2DJM9_9SPHN|nr:TadE/TadG family type IV pilus assembly protein [Parasphingorhabdus halotolerans]QJB68193.1 hypothetical protein HF685_01815 [Parasphingorhabdus halotolerans]
MLGNKKTKRFKSILRDLRTDNTGNIYFMAALALFPIAGFIGGGVDMGRAYMAKARLQQACDAGALAGRRSMSGIAMSNDDKIEARKFFDFNFPEGTFGTNNFAPVNGQANPRFVDGPKLADGTPSKTVYGYAETTVNTSIMRIFGFQTMQLKVDCTSRLDIGNVDVVMSLDVTGSMSGSRIQGLKDAVKQFYDILGPGGAAQGSQIRYGFVPYNALVNPGKLLYDANPAWIVGGTGTAQEDEWNYQTRKAIWLLNPPVVTYEDIRIEDATGDPRDGCEDLFSENKPVPGAWNPSGPVNGQGNKITVSGNYYKFTYNQYKRKNKNNITCTRKVEKYAGGPPATSSDWQPGAVFDHWEYDEYAHNVSAYVASIKTGVAAQRPTLNNNPSSNTDGPKDKWDGCIEERDTYQDIISTTNAIPVNAYDLDLDLVPYNKATRWRPYWEGVEYKRNGSTVSSSDCPAPARILAAYPQYDGVGYNSPTDNSTPVQITSNLKSYINGLTAQGYTNHTIGMLWAGRLISKEGLFSAVNSKSKNGFNISRHILFMTDGDLNVNPDRYNVYGYNQLDGRLGPTSIGKTEYEARQAQRFQLACNAAKAKGITVWAVQFGVSNPTKNMEDCATSKDHASAASSNADLVKAFGDIAKTIGGLRLSK